MKKWNMLLNGWLPNSDKSPAINIWSHLSSLSKAGEIEEGVYPGHVGGNSGAAFIFSLFQF